MRVDIIAERDALLVRRLVLEPGEATPWHVDRCRRLTVVVSGERLSIEYRDTGEQMLVDVAPGQAEWDEPEARVHRATNAGSSSYEEIVTFFLEAPGSDPQPQPE